MNIDYEVFARKNSDRIKYLQYEGHEPVFMLPRSLVKNLDVKKLNEVLLGLHREEGLFKRVIPQMSHLLTSSIL